MSKSTYSLRVPFRVRYSESDQQGLLFNAHYLNYFDTAIVEYFRSLPYDLMLESRKGVTDFHVVRSTVEYKKPIQYDREVDVAISVERIGNSSITFRLAIFPKDSNELLSTGQVVWVNADQSTGKSSPISAELRARIEKKEAIT